MGIDRIVISTDEMGLETTSGHEFSGRKSLGYGCSICGYGIHKYMEEQKNPDIIFVEGQSSLTERGNPHPRGLSAALMVEPN